MLLVENNKGYYINLRSTSEERIGPFSQPPDITDEWWDQSSRRNFYLLSTGQVVSLDLEGEESFSPVTRDQTMLQLENKGRAWEVSRRKKYRTIPMYYRLVRTFFRYPIRSLFLAVMLGIGAIQGDIHLFLNANALVNGAINGITAFLFLVSLICSFLAVVFYILYGHRLRYHV